MAENRVYIEGMFPDGVFPGFSSNPLPTVTVINPAIDGVYVHSIANTPGVVAANNFLSIFNPLGSGKVLSIGGLFFSSTSAGAASETEPLRMHRISAASAGTLQPDSATVKFQTGQPDPVAEVRIGNPTVTLGSPFVNSPPVITVGSGGTGVHEVPLPPGVGPFTCLPGEGVVARTAAGDTDQRWNITVLWAEI